MPEKSNNCIPIVEFQSKSELEIEANIKCFIHDAKTECNLFEGKEPIVFEDNDWNFSKRMDIRKKVANVRFYPVNSEAPFQEPFLTQAKAIIAQYYMNRKLGAGYQNIVYVLGCIYTALQKAHFPLSIFYINNIVCDMTVAEFRDCSKYEAVSRLKIIIDEIIMKYRLTQHPLNWEAPILKRDPFIASLVDDEANAKKGNSKLPDIRILFDLAGVFHKPIFNRDIVTMSWFALAMYSPSRVSEILSLPTNCERWFNDNGEKVHGIVWEPAKGSDPMIKYAISDLWAEIAGTAINRLTDLGVHAREVAKWYEKNKKLYLPESMEDRRDDYLSIEDVIQVLGVEEGATTKNLGQSCRVRFKRWGLKPFAYVRLTRKVKEYIKSGKRLDALPSIEVDIVDADSVESGRGYFSLYDFADLEKFALASLPDSFPYTDSDRKIKCSEALFVYSKSDLSRNDKTVRNLIEVMNGDVLAHDLKPGNKSSPCIFERHELRCPESGECWGLTTHQPRHLLNTLAQSKYLSQELIAFWSGRKNKKQNSWYDSLSQIAVIEAYTLLGDEAAIELQVDGPLADKCHSRALKEPITYKEALRRELGSIHITRYSICKHNFSVAPCPKDKDCISCGESYYIKGNEDQLAEANAQILLHEKSIANCLIAIENDEPGVEDWLSKHQLKLDRWTYLHNKMIDPSIPDGIIITLPNAEYSSCKASHTIALKQQQADDFDLSGMEI